MDIEPNIFSDRADTQLHILGKWSNLNMTGNFKHKSCRLRFRDGSRVDRKRHRVLPKEQEVKYRIDSQGDSISCNPVHNVDIVRLLS